MAFTRAARDDDGDETCGESHSMCSPRTPCASPASTCFYDSDGFPIMRARSCSSLASFDGLDVFGGASAPEGDGLDAESAKDDAYMRPINPSSRKRRTEAMSAVPQKPRGRPKKNALTPKTPKTPKPRSKQAAKTPKSQGKAKAAQCDVEDGVLSRVCCAVTQKPQPRAELTAYVPQPGGAKRVHVFTLSLKGWGSSFADDAKALKHEIVEKGLTKRQAIEARDSLSSSKR
jgi:hypothetical protein